MKKFVIALFLGLFVISAAPMFADTAVVEHHIVLHRHHHHVIVRHHHHVIGHHNAPVTHP